MKQFHKCCALIIAATIIAVALRLPQLRQRPMHCDEAVHAAKFDELLEDGIYRYDRYEYHGPTLNYFTLIPAWLCGVRTYASLNETVLRIVPVFFGVLLVALSGLLVKGLGCKAAVITALLAAVSPAMVFYSRYYIQEILLVCFSFGLIVCGYRYLRRANMAWAIGAGAFIGLMHATKETCIISWLAMAGGLLSLMLTNRTTGVLEQIKTIKLWHVVAALASVVVVSASFNSSFFTNIAGIWDSLRTYEIYFGRAGQNKLHIHPWYYYLWMLIYSKASAGPLWSEGVIVILAIAGYIAAISKIKFHDELIDRNLLRFLAFYTLILTVIYSAIPYKTPWCLLGFLHGMILMAAVGAAVIIERLPAVPGRVFLILLVIAGGWLTFQACQGSYRYYDDHANPYVYAHTGRDVFAMVDRIEKIARADKAGRDMYIQVIASDDDYWPLPWYLRSFSRVSWQNKIDNDLPSAPVIIASVDMEPELIKKLYQQPPPGQRPLYMPLFDSYMQLRPTVELRGYVKKSLWDDYQRTKND